MSTMPQRIKDYNAMPSVATQNISDLEAKVICLLPSQTDTFLKELSYHWQNYKNFESAVPMKLFEFMGELVPPEASGVWKDILTPSAKKNECFLFHLIGVFTKKIKDAILHPKPNLRFHASKFRLSDPLNAYRQACLRVHFTLICRRKCRIKSSLIWRNCFCGELLIENYVTE